MASNADEKPESKRWAFLGTGRVIHRMVDAIFGSQTSELKAIASREIARAKTLLQELKLDSTEVKACLYEQAINDPDIDWIYVATVPSSHCELTLAALNAGKNVLCEKPLALNSAELLGMTSLAQEKNLKLIDATSFPYHHRTARWLEILAANELGVLRKLTIACSFNALANRPEDHRHRASSGGGCLLDLGWYCAYATAMFLPANVTSILATGNNNQQNSVGGWQTFQAILSLENEAFAHWDCSFQTLPRKWIEIAGTNGSLVCDDLLRPVDLEKPRFWFHDLTSNAKVELIGAGTFQEQQMIDQIVSEPSATTRQRLQIAIKAQQLLELAHQAALRYQLH